MVGQLIEDGDVDRLAHGRFAGRPGHGKRDIGTRLNQNHPLRPKCLGLFEGIELARALDPVIATKPLVDHEITHALAKPGIRDVLQQILLFGRKVDGVHMVEKMGRAGKADLGRFQPVGQRRKVHRQPVLIEILVREIMAILRLQLSKALGDLRMDLGIGRIGRHQLVNKIQRPIDAADNPGTFGTECASMLGHQMAHRCKRCPAGLGVVADVECAAHLEFASDKIRNHAPVVIGNPAPDTVQTDAVEIRQIASDTEVGKGFVIQLRGRPRRPRKRLGEARMHWIEIGGVPRIAGSRRVDVGAHALTETQLAMHALRSRDQTGVEKSQPRAQRIELGIVAEGVINVGGIAGSPIAHHSPLRLLWCTAVGHKNKRLALPLGHRRAKDRSILPVFAAQ